MAAGDYTATELFDIIVREDELWDDPRSRRLYEPKIETLRAVLENQTARVERLANTMDQDVKITYIDATSIGTQAISASCTPAGAQLETKGVLIQLTDSREATPFKVPIYSSLRNNRETTQRLMATGMLMQRKQLDEYLDQGVAAKLLANAGQNKDTTGEFNADVTTDSTYIPANQWDEDIIPYFAMTADLNRFASPYFVHGANLYMLAKVAAPKDSLNDDERDFLAKYQMYAHYWDTHNFAALNENNLTLMIDAGAVAFASVNYHTDTPDNIAADVSLFRVPSRATYNNGTPIAYYDVFIQRQCLVVNGQKEWYDVVEMKLPKWGLIVNPATFQTGNNGILEFRKGTRPA